MACRWVLGLTGATGGSGAPRLNLLPGLGLPEAVGGSGCDSAVGAVPQGTCTADLYRHPQLDADIEAVKEIYSENAVAVRWVLCCPLHRAVPHPGTQLGPARNSAALSPGIQLCSAWVPSGAMPSNPAVPSLKHLAMVLPEHLAMAPPGTWLCHLWGA